MDIELKLVDPGRNRHRHYTITEARTLFGEPCLVITWDRIGRRCRVRTDEVFASHEDLAQRCDELLERRRQHGYVAAE